MKKKIKRTIIILDLVISLPVLLLVVTMILYNNYKPDPVNWSVDEKDISYFRESYEESRAYFRSTIEELPNRFNNVESSYIPIENSKNEDLTIDYAYIPSSGEREKLFVLTSGVHGIEGFSGTAIQVMFMKELLDQKMIEKTGVLIIHGINPYGFKYKRRFTENNVDLNRNAMFNVEGFSSVNQGYSELVDWLNPQGPVNTNSLSNRFFHVGAVVKILQYSMSSLRQASLQGQYELERGIMFGGKSLEPSITAVTPLIKRISEEYETVFNIELHTGYGTNGVLHLFPKPLKDENRKEQTEELFEGYSIDWGDSDDFYTFDGDFATYIGDILPGKHYLTMTFEFGTLDTKKTLGSIRALHNLILENQGFNYGYMTQEDEEEVAMRILEGYNSSSLAWRSKVVADSREVISISLERFLQNSY